MNQIVENSASPPTATEAGPLAKELGRAMIRVIEQVRKQYGLQPADALARVEGMTLAPPPEVAPVPVCPPVVESVAEAPPVAASPLPALEPVWSMDAGVLMLAGRRSAAQLS